MIASTVFPRLVHLPDHARALLMRDHCVVILTTCVYCLKYSTYIYVFYPYPQPPILLRRGYGACFLKAIAKGKQGKRPSPHYKPHQTFKRVGENHQVVYTDLQTIGRKSPICLLLPLVYAHFELLPSHTSPTQSAVLAT